LTLLAMPLNDDVLRVLEDEDRSLPDLRREVGHPPATTMRHYLKTLTELGVVERRQEAGFPGSVSYALTRSGKRLLAVRSVLWDWLEQAPGDSMARGSTAAKTATKALVDGWSTGIVRALAARPLTLTELSKLIPQVSYPTLERRLTAMRLAGQLEASREKGIRGTPYCATTWLRAAAAPLGTAAGWERRCAPSRMAPLSPIDIEAILLLAVPLMSFPLDLSGSCRLAVELRGGSGLHYAGVVATIREGRVVSCLTRLSDEADGWITGSPMDWLRWVNGSDGCRVELGGDDRLARRVAEGVQGGLVGPVPTLAA
jgi:DNA-binding HxlR family transcriptional regulator